MDSSYVVLNVGPDCMVHFHFVFIVCSRTLSCMLHVMCDVVCRLCSMLCVVCLVQISGWVLNPSQPQRQQRRHRWLEAATMVPTFVQGHAKQPSAGPSGAAKKPVLVQAESWSRGSWISWLDLHPTTSTAWAWSAAGSNRDKMPKYVTNPSQLTCGCDRQTQIMIVEPPHEH